MFNVRYIVLRVDIVEITLYQLSTKNYIIYPKSSFLLYLDTLGFKLGSTYSLVFSLRVGSMYGEPAHFVALSRLSYISVCIRAII